MLYLNKSHNFYLWECPFYPDIRSESTGFLPMHKRFFVFSENKNLNYENSKDLKILTEDGTMGWIIASGIDFDYLIPIK